MKNDMKIYHARISDIQSIPKRIGAYVITHTFDNIHAEKYAGSSKNLYQRMRGHYAKNIMYIDLYITDDIDLAESLERIFIELIKPATNIQIPTLSDEDNERMNELLEDSKIKNILLDNVVKIGYRNLKYVNRDNRKIKIKRMITEYQSKNKKIYRLQIPEEMGLRGGDVVKFERIDENTVILKKLT